jgi:hypothetical protein
LDLFAAPYRSDGIRWFLEPLDQTPRPEYVTLYADKVLSIVPSARSPLAGDAFHQVFQFGPHHLRLLFGFEGHTRIDSPEGLARAAGFAPNSLVLWAQSPRLIGNESWRGLPPASKPGHQQWIGRTVLRELVPRGGGAYQTREGIPAQLSIDDQGELLLETAWIEQFDAGLREPWLSVRPAGTTRVDSYRLLMQSPQRYRVERGPGIDGATLWLGALRIERRLVGGERP